jgi:hypothetical protein
MNVQAILQLSEPSLLIVEDRPERDIVVGVPHHAPAGTDSLPCTAHPESDENAGFLGRYLAGLLKCPSVIACNYPVDVNKYFRSDYSMQIAQWNPKVLVEIHGHGGRKANFDVEISSGSAQNNRYSVKFAEDMAVALAAMKPFPKLTMSGEYDKVYFKASDSVTITDGRWVAYHMELPRALRKPARRKTGKPPIVGFLFCDALAAVLQVIHRP